MVKLKALLLLFVGSCAALPPLATGAQPDSPPVPLIPTGGLHITNGVITLGISMRDAGAVSSLVFAGQELVNDHDHGRQLQIAWSYDALGETDNPTEAGSATDGTGETSSSQLLEVTAHEATLTTKSHPAYWFPTGFKNSKGLESAATQLTTADTLEKTLTLGYQGDPHVIIVDSAISIAQTPTAPPVTSLVIETPAFYVPPLLTESYLLDRTTGALLLNSPKTAEASPDPERILILSSADGHFAVALYAPSHEHFMSYNSRYVDRHGKSDDNVAKITLHYRQNAQPGEHVAYRTFAIVGDLETVKSSLMRIH